jgi:hypothetical protein
MIAVKPGKESGFRRAGGDVVDTGLAQSSNRRAIRFAVVGRADAMGAIREINRVHSVDANQQNAFDMAFMEIIVLGDCTTHRTGSREAE